MFINRRTDKEGVVYIHTYIHIRNTLAVQWLGLHAFTAEGAGSIPGQRTKIPQATQRGKKKESLKMRKMKYPELGDSPNRQTEILSSHLPGTKTCAFNHPTS